MRTKAHKKEIRLKILPNLLFYQLIIIIIIMLSSLNIHGLKKFCDWPKYFFGNILKRLCRLSVILCRILDLRFPGSKLSGDHFLNI